MIKMSSWAGGAEIARVLGKEERNPEIAKLAALIASHLSKVCVSRRCDEIVPAVTMGLSAFLLALESPCPPYLLAAIAAQLQRTSIYVAMHGTGLEKPETADRAKC